MWQERHNYESKTSKGNGRRPAKYAGNAYAGAADAGINPEVVDPEDVEMLEDLLIAALNEAMRKIDEEEERELSSVTGGLNIPGL